MAAGDSGSGLSKPRVLLVLPDVSLSTELGPALARGGFEPRLVLSPEAATIAAAHERPSALVVHADFLTGKGKHVVEALRMTAPQSPLLAWVDDPGGDARLQALLLGAEDCLVSPFATEEAVIRIRRAVERRDGLRRLALENQSSRERAERMVAEVSELRGRLQKTQALLQHGVEFHQRLDAGEGSEALIRRLLGSLSLELHVERLAFVGPEEPGVGHPGVAAWGLDAGAPPPSLPAGSELAKVLAASGTPATLERLAAVPALKLETIRLAASGFVAAVPLLRRGTLGGLVLLGEVREGGAPSPELLQLAHYMAAPLIPLLGAAEDPPRKTCA